MKQKQYYVYLLASKRNGTLYIGVTDNLARRIWEHRNKITKSFTQKYNVNQLIYYEIFTDIGEAILRETRLKRWKRVWKIKLIEENHPNWKDLYDYLE